MSASTGSRDVTSSISQLTIDPTKKTAAAKSKSLKPKKKVADSWEDEDDSTGSDEGDGRPSTADPDGSAGTAAPPPTPVSPNYNVSQDFGPVAAALSPGQGYGATSRRPEKTDAVARRMIAGALGVKVPKQTEEQKAYEKAVKEKERKRRDEERAADKKRQENLEKARKAVWED